MSAIASEGETETEPSMEATPPPPASAITPPAVTYPEGGLQGWLVVLGVWCVMFITFGYVNAFGIYEAYYLENFLANETPSTIAWIGSIQFSLLFMAGLISGPITDRFGPKAILYPSCFLFVLSQMLTSLCKQYYQFLLAQGILAGLTAGLIYAPAVAMVGHYFLARRALAMSVASSGSSLGGVLFPIMLDRMLNYTTLGFPWTVRIIGFLLLALCIIACVTINPRIPPRKGAYLLGEAFTHPIYTLQVTGLFLLFLGMTTPFIYLPYYATYYGLSTTLANATLSTLNAGSLIGRLLVGPLTSIFGRFNTLTLAGLLSGALCLIWLACKSTAAILVFSILFGFSTGIVIALFPTTLASAAPHPSQIGSYVGMALGILGLGGVAGGPIAGALIRGDGNAYGKAAGFAGAVMLAGAGFVGVAGRWTAGFGRGFTGGKEEGEGFKRGWKWIV